MGSQSKRTISIFVMATLATLCLAVNGHAWWDGSWTKRSKLTFNNSDQSQNLQYFPVLIKLDSSRINYAATQDQGQDIRFVDSNDSTLLAHEIEKWDEAGTSYVWVKVPQIDGSSDTDYIWMYYGNRTASDGQNKEGVWDDGGSDYFKMVHHLEENTDSANGILDSTSNGNHGTPYSDTTITNLYTPSGYVDGADGFDGSDDYIDVNNNNSSLNVGQIFTFTCWAKRGNTGEAILHSKFWGSYYSWKVSFDSSDRVRLDIRGDDGLYESVTGATVTDTGWHHIAARSDGSELRVFLDGQKHSNVTSKTKTIAYDSSNLKIGVSQWGGTKVSYFISTIDEVRISNTNRSDDWIAADYKSMTDTFITYQSTTWWDGSWGERIRIAFDKSPPSQDLSDFPVLIKLDSSRIDYNKTQNQGQDIRFVASDDTTLLPHEIEKWDDTGTSYVWVKVPVIKSSQPYTYIFMYYGNTGASDGQNVNAVWSNGYAAVYHLKETSDQHVNSTGDYNHSSSIDVATQGSATGKIDGADDLETDDDDAGVKVNDNSTLDITEQITLEAWIKAESSYRERIVNKTDAYTLRSCSSDVSNNLHGYLKIGGVHKYARSVASVIKTDGSYQYVVFTWDGRNGYDNKLKLYNNGTEVSYYYQDTQQGTIDVTATDLWIGSYGDPLEETWDGVIDEVRISSVARSDDWIAAQHNSMMDTFATYTGAEKACPWWDGSWGKRVPVTITYSGSALTNYQVKVDVAYDADMQPNFDDIRFIDSNHTTELDYYRESDYTASSSAIFWVEVPSIPDGGKTIYMYYNNGVVSTTSSGPNTFEYFDDFESVENYSTGPVSGQNGWAGPLGSDPETGEIKNTDAFSGTQQVEHYSPGDYNAVSSEKVINLGTDRLINARICLITKGDTSTADTHLKLIDLEGEEVRLWTRREYSETNWVAFYNDTYYVTSVAFTPGSYVRVQIGIFNGGTMDYWIDGTQVYDDQNQNFDEFEKIALYSDENAGMRFDEAFIRKYVSNEPTTSTSSEENPVTKRWGDNTNCDYTGGTEDTFIDGDSVTIEEGTCTGSWAVRVGHRTDAGDRTNRGLIKFNLSGLQDLISNSSQIVSAYLKVRVANNIGSTTFDAYRLLKDWYEGDECHPATDADPGETTWQWQSQPTEWSSAGADGAGLDRESSSGGTFSVNSTGWKSWDLTQSVKDMFDSKNYYGWVLKSQAESGDNYFAFNSSEEPTPNESYRPYLEITYIPPGAADLQQVHYRWRNDDGYENGPSTTRTWTYQKGDGKGTVSETDDASLRSDNQTTNYGDAVDLLVDDSPDYHTVIKFPNIFGEGANQIPLNSTINSATLTVEVYDPGTDIAVYQLTESWVEDQVTWNNRVTGTPWSTAGAQNPGCHKTTADDTFTATTGTHTIDVKTSLQYWSNGEANEGWVLIDTTSGGVDMYSSEYGTVTSRPKLEVTFVSGKPVWNVQSYQGNMGAQTSLAVPISAVSNLDRAFILAPAGRMSVGRGSLSTAQNSDEVLVRARLTATNEVTLTRGASTNDSSYSFFVIEDTTGDEIYVKSGTASFADDFDTDLDINVGAGITDYTKTVVFLTASSDHANTNRYNEAHVRGYMTSNTNLALRRNASGGSIATVDWFVVEFKGSGWSVQQGDFSLTTGIEGSPQTQTINPVTVADSFVFMNWEVDTTTLGDTSAKVELFDSTTLRFSRQASTSGTVTCRYFVVSHSDLDVQRGSDSAASGESTQDQLITPVDTARAFPIAFNDSAGTGTGYPIPYWRAWFSDSSTLNWDRARTGQTSNFLWQVIDLLGFGTVSGASWAATEDTAYSPLDKGKTIRLRLMVSNEGGSTSGSIQYRLQYKESTDGTWTNVPDSATSEHWQMKASNYIDDAGEPTSDIDPGLTNPGGGTFVPGELRDNTALTSGIELLPNRFTEIEYSIEATTNAPDGQTYYFRVTRSDGTTDYFTYPALLDNYPKVTLAGVLQDTDPPTPDPMSFATAPNNVDASSISMTATTGSDATPPIEYQFTLDCTDCGANAGTGGDTRSWDQSTSYTDDGLQPNKCYGYTVQARDSVTPTPNTGTASSASITYTSANVPGTPTLSNPTLSTLDLDNNDGGNPSSNPTTEFAVQVVTTDPEDLDWFNKWVDLGGNPSASEVWMDDATLDALTLQGLNAGTTYGVKVKAKNQDNEVTNLSEEGQGITVVDTDPPTPDPMSFATAPNNVDASSISMTATTGSDATPPIEYQFTLDCTDCGADAGTGGDTRSWDQSTSYTDDGLQPNKCYGYTVQARDSVTPTPNTGGASGALTAYTSANIPGTPTLSNPTLSTLDLDNDDGGNPSSNPTTEFAVQVVTTDPEDLDWFNKWVDLGGNPSASEVWMDDATLDALTLQGLNAGTTYGVKVKAKNQDNDETALGAEGQGMTTSPTFIYYSVGTSRQTETDLKNASTVTINSGTAIFSEPQPYNIGVGDEVNYGGGAGTNVYISGRTSSTVYSVTTATGDVPTDVTEPTTVNSIKRAFGSLSAANTGSGDGSHLDTFVLASGNGYQLNWVCYADEATDNNTLTVDGWTTGPNNYIRIYTPTSSSEVGESQRHDGTWGTGFMLTPSSGSAIEVNDDYVRIEGIAMQPAAGGAGVSVSGMSTNNDVRISHCLMVGRGAEGNTRGLIANDADLNLTVWNTIAYNNYGWQNFYVYDCNTVYFYNCTAYKSSGGQGFRFTGTTGTVTVKNCISMANNYDFYSPAPAGFDASSDYNMSSDDTAPGSNPLTGKDADSQFVSNSEGYEDFHLKTGSDAIDTVTDPPTSFDDDIDGDTRPVGTYWDRGADEHIARSLTLADHGSGQVGDKFTTTTSVTDVLFRFNLTRTGTVTVDTLRVNFTYNGGVLNSDVSNGELWVDRDDDGVVDNPGDTLIEGSVTPSAGILTFTTDFTPGTGGTNYLVRATVDNLDNDDTTTLSIGTIDKRQGAEVTQSGAITPATHLQDQSGLSVTTDGSTITIDIAGKDEITFDIDPYPDGAGGGIYTWYDLETDPSKTYNLIADGGNSSSLTRHHFTVSSLDKWENDSQNAQLSILEYTPARVVIRRTGTYGDLCSVRFDHLYTVYPSGEIYIDRNADFTGAVSSEGEHLGLCLTDTPTWTESEENSNATSDWIGGCSNDTNYKADPFMVLSDDWTLANANETDSGTGYWQHRYGKAAESFSIGRYELPDMLVRLKPSNLTATGGKDYSEDYRNPSPLDNFTAGGGAWVDASENTSDGLVWWDSNYAYRRQLTIDSAPSGYSIKLTMTGTTASDIHTNCDDQTNGNDFRVAWWDGSQWNDLDRYLESFSSSDITVWFRIQEAGGWGGGASNYYLYYGNTSPAAVKDNKSNIYDLWDDFDYTGTGWQTNWTTWLDDGDGSTVNVTAASGVVTIDPGSSRLGGLKHNSYVPDNTYGFVARVRASAVAVTDDHAPVCWFINVPDGETYAYQTRGSSSDRNRYVRKYDSGQPAGDDIIIQDDTTLGPFPSAGVWYTYEVHRKTDGTMRAFRDGTQQFPPLPGGGWSTADTSTTSGDFGIGGESSAGEDYEFDWIWARKFVDPEPSASAGDEETSSSISDFFNEAEGCYTIDMDDGQVLVFDIHGIPYERYSPAFKIRNYRSLDDPPAVYRDGSLLLKGPHYNVGVIPFSEAWYSATSSPDPSWWDVSYDYRKKITLSAGSKAIPDGYPVKFSFNHKNLVDNNKSLANGDDIRIVYWDGFTWTQLDRALFNDNINSSSWNDCLNDTTIMFKTQAEIPAGNYDEGYYLYYGNTGASSPLTNTLSSRYFLEEQVGEFTTSSTSYVDLDPPVSLTFTPSSADEHWVVVATWRQRHVGDSGTEQWVGHGRVSLNGTPRIGTSDLTYYMSGNVWKTFHAFLKITGETSPQTVSLEFRARGGTDAIDNARIVAFLIPDDLTGADIQYDEALTKTTDTGATPPGVDALTTTFTPSKNSVPTAGDYIWMANGFCVEKPGGATNGGLFAEDETGADQQNTKESYFTATDRFVPFIHFERRQNLTATEKTFTIRHQPDPTNGSDRQGLTQLLFRTDVFDAVEVASSTGVTGATTSYQTKNTLTTASVGSAQDYVYLAVMGFRLATRDIALSSFGEIRLGDTEPLDQQLEEEVAIDRDNYQRQIAWAWAENGTGNRTIDSRIKDTAAGHSEAQYAHIISLRYIEPTIAPDIEEDKAGTTYTRVAEGGLSSSSSEYLTRTDNNYTLFDSPDKYLYLGSRSKFTGVNIDLQQVGVGDALLTWQYYRNGTGWTDLTVPENDVKNFKANGCVSFSQPSDWVKTSISGGTELYYVRVYLPTGSGSYSPAPIENLIKTDILLLQYLPIISGTTIGLIGPTAVDLVDFHATGNGDAVLVSWRTAMEINNLGFNLYRSTTKDGSYTKLNSSLIPGLLYSATGKTYTYDDGNVTRGKLYYYKLEDINTAGKHTWHGPVCVDWDGDGMPDDWEIAHGLDPTVDDGDLDYDNDGLTNYEEYELGTDPLNPDTDGDGILDGDEFGGLPTEPGGAGKGDGIKVISQDETGLVLELRTSQFDSTDIVVDGTTYQRLAINAYTHGLTETVGSPEIPLKGYWIDLPEGMGLELELETTETQTSSGYLVYPVPEKIVLEEEIIEEFSLDPEAYAQDSFSPEERARTGKIAHLRDQKKAQILFSPLSFNPQAGELRLHTLIRVRITYVPGQGLAMHGLGFGPQATDPDPDWPPLGDHLYKIKTTGEGIYRISYDELQSAGMDLSTIDPRNLHLYNWDDEVPIYISGEVDGSFDDNDYILFYAEAITMKYTRINVYWLVAEDTPSLMRMTEDDGTPGSADVAQDFLSTIHHEQDAFYWGMAPGQDSVDRWFFGQKISAGQTGNFPVALPAVSGLGGTATVRVAMRGSAQDKPHEIEISLNGTQIDLGSQDSWQGQDEHLVTAEVDQQQFLVPGENTVSIKLLGYYDSLHLDWIEVTYFRNFEAADDSLGFSHEAGYLFEIPGFSTHDLAVLDITYPLDARIIQGIQVAPDNTLSFQDQGTEIRTYIASKIKDVKANDLQADALITHETPPTLKDTQNRADYIIITHRDIGWDPQTGQPFDWLRDLGEFRGNQGLRVVSVDVDGIYDCFNYGFPHPQAVKDFISYAYHNWQGPAPQYVVLVGDATYDPKGNHFVPTPGVPTYLGWTRTWGETAIDDWFVQIVGTDTLGDLYLGRLPAADKDEASLMVRKIIDYEEAPKDESWQKRLLLVSDDREMFKNMNETISFHDVPADYSLVKGYLDDTPLSVLTDKIKDEINDPGVLMVNYAGHGFITNWAKEGIFDTTHIKLLSNDQRLPVMVMMTCMNGYFLVPDPDWGSLAEEMLRADGAGAVAAFASTGLTEPPAQMVLNRAFMKAIFQQGMVRLGEATSYAKQELLANSENKDAAEDTANTFILMGDPAMALPVESPTATTAPIVWGGGGGSGGGCFIATAAYGSFLDGHVVALRSFRDRWLILSPIGKYLVTTYYTVSPSAAGWIKAHENIRALSRIALTPVVAMAQLELDRTLTISLVLLLLASPLAWLHCLTRRRKVHSVSSRH